MRIGFLQREICFAKYDILAKNGGIILVDQYENIVNQYNIQVRNSYKGRGAIILETDLGLKLLKEIKLHEDKIMFLCQYQEIVSKDGFYVDKMIRNKEGELFVLEDNKKYIIKDWVEGRELYFNDKNEVLVAIRYLAKIHRVNVSAIKNPAYEKFNKANSLIETLEKHNKELVRIRNGIKRMGRWSEFDLLFLKSFDCYYNEAKKSIASINKIYEKVLNQYNKNQAITHGQYNHHNLLFNENKDLHIFNFEYACYNLPIIDLYSMLRKTLEKNDWDIKFGLEAVEEYNKIYELSKEERQLLAYLFAYPEKYWKISNYYFNLNKAWKPKQTLIKLKRLIGQEEKKQKFIEELRGCI